MENQLDTSFEEVYIYLKLKIFKFEISTERR